MVNRRLIPEGAEGLPVYKGESGDPLKRRDLAADYPLLFTDEHSAFINHHAWMRDVPWLRELQRHPYVKVHPTTAEKYGIRERDLEITSPHGTMKATARLFSGLRPDTLMGQHGWWQACSELGLSETSPLQGGTNPNVLYDWQRRDPLSGDITKDTLVKIRRLSAKEG